MEKKPPLVMTPFDESLTNDFLQLVKIILPVIIYFMFVCVLSIYNMMLGSKYILPLT